MDQNKRNRIREIAVTELKKGKSPAEIVDLALAAGIPKTVVYEEFSRLAEAGSIGFFGILKNFSKDDAELRQIIDKGLEKIWDPVGEAITLNSFHGMRQELEETVKKYLKNPNLPRRNLFLFCIPIVITAVLALFIPSFAFAVAKIDDGNGIMLFLLPFVPATIYVYRIFQLQRDMINMLIAAQEHWIYSPGERADRWLNMKNKFPELFQKGNTGQNLQDEFWGKHRGKKYTADFWCGIFEYVVESQGTKGRRSRTTYRKNVFGFKLGKKLKTDFRLEPEHLGNKILNFFRRKEIDTESVAFNQAFAVFYNGEKIREQLEIVKILSPSVQVRLLELKAQYGSFVMQFRDDAVMIMFPGRILKRMKTNFFLQVAVDSRDKEAIRDRLNNILEISGDILRFLD